MCLSHVRAWRLAGMALLLQDMFRVVILVFLIGAIPWAITTWWQMRRAQSARERAWVGRMSLGLWLGSLISALAVVTFALRGQFLALPIIGAGALGVRYGLRKARARIRMEEGDAFSRAKRVN